MRLFPALACLNAVAASNLLTNGGPDQSDLDGWTTVANGGAGWTVSGTEGDYAAYTSYGWCRREQTVDVGEFASAIDGGSLQVIISEEVKERFSQDRFYISADFCSTSACSTILESWDECTYSSPCYTQTSSECWTCDDWVVHNFTGAVPVGTRFIRFSDGGIDGEYWAGHYGPSFRYARLEIIAFAPSSAPTASPVPTASFAPTPLPSTPASTTPESGLGVAAIAGIAVSGALTAALVMGAMLYRRRQPELSHDPSRQSGVLSAQSNVEMPYASTSQNWNLPTSNEDQAGPEVVQAVVVNEPSVPLHLDAIQATVVETQHPPHPMGSDVIIGQVVGVAAESAGEIPALVPAAIAYAAP